MKDFPVRPAARQLQKVEAPGFTVALLEQPIFWWTVLMRS